MKAITDSQFESEVLKAKGLVIVGAMALSLWFAVQYVRITNRVGLLERKIAELKKCTEHSI